MADNSRKTPLAQTLPAAIRSQIAVDDEIDGKIFPCHVVEVDGPIVTVAFDIRTNYTLPQVTMPILGSEYVRLPIQPGCKGIAVSADAYLGPISGLGGSTATTLQPSNLGSLAFIPIGNKSFSAVDPNVLVLYGPNGVTIRDQASGAVITLTNGSILMQHGTDAAITLDSMGVHISGDLFINAVNYLAHVHTNVTNGPDNTGGVLA